MSKYTTEVRYICEELAGLSDSVGYNDITRVIKLARKKVFDFSYPIFDEGYRETLETKILTHYYTREIGLETVGLWKHFLKMRMNEIMPYYNKLYNSELIMPQDPFNDTDYTREGERHGVSEHEEAANGTDKMTGTITDIGSDEMSGTVGDSGNDRITGTVVDDITSSSEDGGSDSKSRENEPRKDTWTLYSDTPQGGVGGITAAEPSVGSNAYLTNATHVIESGVGSNDDETTTYGKTNDTTTSDTRTYNTTETKTNTRTYNTENDKSNTKTYNTTNDKNNTTNGNGSNDEDYFERIKGKIGKQSYASLIKELRTSFINIDMLIIRDLGDLFMNVY